MRKKLLLLVFLLPAYFLHAQVSIADAPQPLKKSYRYLGVQVNLLLQQFISFNSNSSINSNPYIFSFSKNDSATGSGFVIGSGFQINEVSNSDGVSSSDVRNINISLRVGFEKKYFQEQKFIPFWGIDFAAGVLYNRSSSTLNQSLTNTTNVVETTKIFAGPAFRAGLLFSLSKHVKLGSEFFFNAQIAVTSVDNGAFGFGNNFVPINMGFQAPTALFLIYRY